MNHRIGGLEIELFRPPFGLPEADLAARIDRAQPTPTGSGAPEHDGDRVAATRVRGSDASWFSRARPRLHRVDGLSPSATTAAGTTRAAVGPFP